MSTPGGDASHRDQDFGYEVIGESSSPLNARAPQNAQPIPEQYLQEDIPDHGSPQSAIEEDSIAEQYRGTPPMKSKKKKPDRRSQSHEVSDHVSFYCIEILYLFRCVLYLFPHQQMTYEETKWISTVKCKMI